MVLGQHLVVFGGLTGRVQAFLAAEKRVSPAVIAASVVDCSDLGLANGMSAPVTAIRVARAVERKSASAALRALRCRPWQQDTLPAAKRSSDHDHLVYVGDVRQVASLFWLPVPSPHGLPGHAVQRAAPKVWLSSPPKSVPDALMLGENRVDDLRQPIVVTDQDRLRHMYVVGQTGVGKSTLLFTSIRQDLEADRGVIIIDPLGDLIERILAFYPTDRLDNLSLLDPAYREFPLGFNMLVCTDEDEADQVVENFVGLCYQLFDPQHLGIIDPRFEHAVRNAVLTVLAMKGGTLVEVVRVLTDPQFVRQLLPQVKDPIVQRYWRDRIGQTSDFHKSKVLDYIVSKFSRFVHNRQVRNIIGQPTSSFSPRQVMDEGKVLLISLAQGRLGQQLASFLGLILVPKLLQAAFSRVTLPESQRRPVYLYVDEFQNYASPSFVDILSGARKYGLAITMAHQHTAQLPHEVRSAIFGNAGTLISFRVGLEDAALLAAGMQPSVFDTDDYIALPNYQAIAQVLDQGKRSPAFILATPPAPNIDAERRAWAALVREEARQRHGRPRSTVEAEIARRAML